MQVIKDLLMPSTEQLQIREDLEGVFLSNVHEVEVRIPFNIVVAFAEVDSSCESSLVSGICCSALKHGFRDCPVPYTNAALGCL